MRRGRACQRHAEQKHVVSIVSRGAESYIEALEMAGTLIGTGAGSDFIG